MPRENGIPMINNKFNWTGLSNMVLTYNLKTSHFSRFLHQFKNPACIAVDTAPGFVSSSNLILFHITSCKICFVRCWAACGKIQTLSFIYAIQIIRICGPLLDPVFEKPGDDFTLQICHQDDPRFWLNIVNRTLIQMTELQVLSCTLISYMQMYLYTYMSYIRKDMFYIQIYLYKNKNT